MEPIKPPGLTSLVNVFIDSVNSTWGRPLVLFVMGLMLMLAVGNPLIRWLESLRGMKWSPREDTPDSHLAKAGTPSMGGIGIIGVAVLAWLAFVTFGVMTAPLTGRNALGVPGQRTAWLVALAVFPLTVLLHSFLGFADDWSKARGKGGLRARTKILWQIILAVGFVVSFAFWAIPPLVYPSSTYGLSLARFGEISPLFFLSLFVWVLAIIAAGNAVNLTDGIDGLAAGLSAQCGLILCGIAVVQGRSPLPLVLVLFWAALAGACVGFLAFNRYPAKVFMGDTGSLALGAALGTGAILCRAVWLLPFIGFIFWVETLSVTLQVAYFKWTKRKTGEGKRLFRRAPLHHHFELSGWSEWRVVGTFWLVNLLVSLVGLVLWHYRIIPRWP